MSRRQTYLRHPLEIAPLVFGLIFLGIVFAWALFELDVVSGGDAAWILPIVLIASGALGIVLAATKDRRARRRYESMYVTAPAGSPWPTGAPWPTGTDQRLDDTATTEHATSGEDTRLVEDGGLTEQPTDPDDTDDRNQPGATR
jgi:hypothetical protein